MSKSDTCYYIKYSLMNVNGLARICDLYTVSIGLTGGDVQRRDWRFHRIQRNIHDHKGGDEL